MKLYLLVLCVLRLFSQFFAIWQACHGQWAEAAFFMTLGISCELSLRFRGLQ
jgi:hypothetical protein